MERSTGIVWLELHRARYRRHWLSVQALSALESSDLVVLRCYENAISLPAAWVAYRKALRAIANGSDTVSTTLPTQPAYPSGT